MNGEMEAAFREIYDAYYGDVYRFVCQSVRNQGEAEDLVQEVFLQAYRSFHKFRGECGYKTWLFSIAHNYVNSMWRKFFRRKKIREQYESGLREEQTAAYSMDEEWERRELSQQLHQELQRLPEHYREVIVLRYLHEFSAADAALILGTNEGHVRTLSHRAMTKLRANWEQGGVLPCKIDSKSLPH